MQKSASHKTRVGIFVVVGTMILVAALYFIGNRQHIFSKNIQIYAVFQNVNGLQLGNNVRYSGINVGTVGRIEMVDEARIVIQMMVEEKTGAFIKRDAIATIGSDGLVGSMVVNILPGKANLPVIVSGDTITTYSKIGADDMLSTLNVTNENAALLTADLLKITNKILAGEGALGALITDSTLTKDIRATLENLKNTTSGTNQFIASINHKVSKIDMKASTVGVLLNDTIVGNQMQRIISNLEQSSIDVSKTTEDLESIISEIKTSKSTFNYITKDESLPKTIDSTMIIIKEASQRLNENMEALKHNFLFRGYFRKQERDQKKKDKSSND
ncbi:phospholipid/cholesterol/gamma-HCH transport system substrate-binding protein [Ulvibacter sp. MAR_2010_11]|uniref:MlaD family protein n=1 Tax=Ulvibacter sp. MAR_2010_11 TaxID=1250229 RepID=UPI000C2C906B|nr:MlaD family protein [Ulvibacter sp. MAR_2010_11]PKA84505.1 phospholipid/cholesterol/gamma-HCH transport system substrate-binding protein [Ulvibacter sp. MAR_2010_11]